MKKNYTWMFHSYLSETTWRREIIHEEMINCTGDSLVISVPYLGFTGLQANFIGQDIAFLLKKRRNKDLFSPSNAEKERLNYSLLIKL